MIPEATLGLWITVSALVSLCSVSRARPMIPKRLARNINKQSKALSSSSSARCKLFVTLGNLRIIVNNYHLLYRNYPHKMSTNVTNKGSLNAVCRKKCATNSWWDMHICQKDSSLLDNLSPSRLLSSFNEISNSKTKTSAKIVWNYAYEKRTKQTCTAIRPQRTTCNRCAKTQSSRTKYRTNL